ncbi:MAG: polyphosphate kinase 1 [Oscillospiraceae bacterium]
MSKKQCFDNRELSWLKFNERVLEEARDENVPLCERLTFASIFQSNLDEFFMVRVGSLFDKMLVDPDEKENKTDKTAKEQIDEIFPIASALSAQNGEAYYKIIEKLADYGVEQVNFRDVSGTEEKYLSTYFATEIKPLLSPQIIDKKHPFPFLKNKEIYAVVYIETKGGSAKLGIVPCANGVFERVIFLPSQGKKRFMLAEELILHYVPTVFEGYNILSKSLIRITRNADIDPNESLDHDVDDFREAMEELLRKRKKLSPVRMEYTRKLGDAALKFICENLEIEKWQTYQIKAPLDLSFVFSLSARLSDYPELFFNRRVPQKSPDIPENTSVISRIEKGDVLLSYPYQSIKPFINLLKEAGSDKDVVSIKITLYRVAKNSKIIEALIDAAENGKEVLVLVELRARFDEENNIGWSKQLEDAGCTVIYGLDMLKVHSKLLLITKKSGSGVKFITQIGTGNYNEKTSALYTDLSLMTASTEIGLEAVNIFNALSLGNCVEHTNHLLVAPKCLQNKIIAMIDDEIDSAMSGNPAYIGLKLNSLTDKVIIDKLIEASKAGVKIDLVIRGICCLVSGVKDYTENITVTSIVGRYLEHSRIYIFGQGEKRRVYISSADFMTRNTLRRVEVAVPVYDKSIADRICGIFSTLLADNVKARVQGNDGIYRYKKDNSSEKINAQELFFEKAYEDAAKIKETAPTEKKTSFIEKIKSIFAK